MTIPAWHMDSASFGHPNATLSTTPSNRQFQRMLGDRGQSEFKALNPTAPQKVSLAWEMSDAEFGAFVAAWNSATALCWGANWFTLDLPLMLDYGGTASPTQGTSVLQRIAWQVGQAGTLLGSDWATIHSAGSVTPEVMNGKKISRLTIDNVTGETVIQFSDGGQLRNHGQIRISMNAPGFEGAFGVAVWNGTDAYVLPSAGQDAIDYVANNVGATIGIDLEYKMPLYQRYRCHFEGAYQAEAFGYEMWRVNGSIEIDTTLEPVAAA